MNDMSLVRKYLVFLLAGLVILFTSTACEDKRTSGKGLFLPPGNIDAGRTAFVELGCMQCHSIANTDLEGIAGESLIMLELGGEVRRVKTYGELITSIINPDHIISSEYLKKIAAVELTAIQQVKEQPSPMPAFIHEMTVAQLIDVVTFLDKQYKKAVPEYIGYGFQYVQH